jgi:hypothetical protein
MRSRSDPIKSAKRRQAVAWGVSPRVTNAANRLPLLDPARAARTSAGPSRRRRARAGARCVPWVANSTAAFLLGLTPQAAAFRPHSGARKWPPSPACSKRAARRPLTRPFSLGGEDVRRTDEGGLRSGTLSPLGRGDPSWSPGFSRSGDRLKAGLQRELRDRPLATVERRPLTRPSGTLSPLGRGESWLGAVLLCEQRPVTRPFSPGGEDVRRTDEGGLRSGTLSPLGRGDRSWSPGFSRSGDRLKAGLQRKLRHRPLASVARALTRPSGTLSPLGRGESRSAPVLLLALTH